MLLVISPAKTLDFETKVAVKQATKPKFLDQAAELIELMREYGPDDIVKLMGVSEKIALLNVERYSNWHIPFNRSNAKQSILAFKGDVYTGLNAETFSEQDFEYAQQHLRILSGLYGLLKPLDLMQAYRLEMGIKLPTDQGKNLYEFWGDKITKAINQQLKKLDSNVLVNLASNEYFNSIDKKILKAKIITPVFKDYKNGHYKIISFYAKKARGLMSAYIIQNEISEVEKIKAFDAAGYKFDAASSNDNDWVFLRKEAG